MKIAIVGAGATGLSAAHELSKQGHQITIFEADKMVGGLAAGIQEENWDWSLEKYYHHWFTSDKYLIQLIKELNLSDQLIFSQVKTVSYFDQGFYQLDSVKSVLAFPAFNLIQSLRFGLVTAFLKYIANWHSLEKFTAKDWIKTFYGDKAYQAIWRPLLKGKFGSYYQQANMAWLWARIKARTPKLGTFNGGFQHFLDQFAQHLTHQGVQIHLKTPILQIEPQNNQIVIHTTNENHQFNQVLVTTSPPLFNKLTPSLPKTYTNDISKLKSLAATALILSLDKPLSPQKYYWYNLPKSKDFPLLAIVEHTNFIEPKNFANNHIVYLGDYIKTSDPNYLASKTELIKLYTKALKKINPNFSTSWINKSWHFKTPYAQPVPTINHSKNIPKITTPVKNIFFASMSHIYPWDRGTNYAIKLGKDASSIMTKFT